MISAPCRLGILATLVPGLPVTFHGDEGGHQFVRRQPARADPETPDVGYINISKITKGRRTVTEFRITDLGRERLRLHVMKLQQILDAGTSARDRRRAPGVLMIRRYGHESSRKESQLVLITAALNSRRYWRPTFRLRVTRSVTSVLHLVKQLTTRCSPVRLPRRCRVAQQTSAS